MSRKHKQPLTINEIENALFLDYEGNQDQPPVLLGTLNGTGDGEEKWDLRQIIIHDDFACCAGKNRVKHVTTDDHTKVLREIIGWLAEDIESRHVVAWSEHDLKMAKEHGGLSTDEIALFEDQYRNALYTARRWLRLFHADEEIDSLTLDLCLKLTDVYVPERYGRGRVGYNLRTIRDQFAKRGGTYGDLTDGARAKWREVVGHNKYDLIGMKGSLLVMAKDLAASGQ
jgi:hypothetical protein